MAALAPASEADIAFIMAAERQPGYEEHVGRWDEARHRAAMRDGRHAYFIAQAGGEAAGFAIVRDWGSPERVAMVKRVAVMAPGRGIGRQVMAALVDHVFAETDAWRLWLGHFPENMRAHRAYLACGFVAEGIARGSAWFGGVHRDEQIMAILRPDWEARRRSAISA